MSRHTERTLEVGTNAPQAKSPKSTIVSTVMATIIMNCMRNSNAPVSARIPIHADMK